MKKITILFIAFIFILSSCSNEDSPADTSANILGTWVATSVDYGGESVTEIASESLTTIFVGEGYDIDFIVTFNESPKTYVSDGSYSVHLTSTVEGQTFNQDLENLEFLQDGPWNQIGNKLIVASQDEESEAVIEKLTADELILIYETVEALSQGDATITSTVVARVTFVRNN